MKDIIKGIELLNQQLTDIHQQLRGLHWEDDVASIRILQSDMDAVQHELDKACLVNCTPHPIVIEGFGELPPSGILPRVSSEFEDCLPLEGVRVRYKTSGDGTGLPDPVEGLHFIVSGMVRDALNLSDATSALPEFQSRPDVYAPDTGPDAVRNEKGRIVAVRGLVQ